MSRSIRAVLTFMTAATVLAGGMGAAPAFAAPGVLGAFEVDANLVDDSGAGDPLDWQTLPQAPNCGDVTDGCAVLFTDPFGTQADDVFQGSKEFEPFNWTFDEDGSAPQKADIKNAGVGQRRIDGEDWLYLYFERDGNNGDVFLNFEFNRSDETYVNSTGSTVPVRTTGDLMVAFFVTKGGTVTEIEVLEWQGDHRFGQWVEPTIDPIPVRGTDWEATVNADSKGRFTIGEAALKLQAFDQTPSCPGFGKAWVKTTSSQEFDKAALQDRTEQKDVNLSNCGVKDWTFSFDPQPIAGASVFAVYTIAGDEDRTLQLTDPDGDGTFTAQDDAIPPGSVSYHFEVRNGDDLIWRSDHDALMPGDQDGTESFAAFEHKTNTAGLGYEIDLTPAFAENHAGDAHTLTATVSESSTGDPLPNVPVMFENTGSCGSIDPTQGVSDANGQVTTTLTSETACTTSVVAWVNGAQDGATSGVDEGEANDVATKEFAVYSVSVTPDGDVNEVDSDHSFTVTVTRDDGDDQTGVEGVQVSLTLDPNSANAVITSVNGTELMPPTSSSSCTTDAAGSCSVIIHSENAGDVTLNASTDITNDSGTSTFTGSADKDYVDFRLTIDGGDQTNEVGTDHTFTVNLETNDGSGFVSLSGELVNLALDPSDTDARIIEVNGAETSATSTTCTSDSNGQCTVVITKPTPGTVSLDAVWGTELDSGLVVRTASAQKDYVDYRLTIDGGDATNEVGTEHTFTVSLEQDTGSGFAGLSGESVTLTLDPNTAGASFVSVNGTPASGDTADCTTQADGTCTVVITGTDPGSVTLTASWSTELDSGTVTRSDSADKDYVDYRLTIDGGDQTNEVGSDHTFTVTLEQDSGSGFSGLAGETVTLTLDPNTADARIITINNVEQEPATSGSCVTNSAGQCSVVITASSPGMVTLNAAWSTELDSGTVSRDASADKDYVDFRLTIDGGGETNAVGEEHTFTVTLERDTGDGFAGLAGETVSLDLDPDDTDARIVRVNGTDLDPTATETTCETQAGGSCSVVVNKATPGTIFLNAGWSTELDSGTVTRSDQADKTYGDLRVTIDNGGQTNEVGTDHTFTVTVEKDTGDGFEGIEGASVDLDLDPDDTDARIISVNGSSIDPVTETSCQTDADGTCTVTITKPTAGDVQLNATYEEELDSGTLTRTAAAGKSYVDFRLTIDGGGATNEVGEEHTFTVLLERDTGDGFAALAGEDVDLFLNPNDADAGIVRISGSDIDPPVTVATCTTEADGTCTVVIVGTSGGTSVLNALWGTTLDSGEVSRGDTADKSYVDFELVIDGGDQVNEVGSDHTFTVTLRRDSGAGFEPFAGETVDLSIDQGDTNATFVSINGDEASGTESSCVTDADGTCTVVVNSSEAGTLTLNASWSTELDSGTASRSDEAGKSYEDFRLTVDGGDATNEVGSEHTFTITLERDTGSGFVAYPDQTVSLSIDQGDSNAEFVTINDEAASGTDGSCTTDANGMCTVVVNSSEAGTLTLSASWSRELDSGTATRSDEADKSYVDFELTVSPETSTNDVGTDHTFTVTLRRDTGADFEPLAGETVDLSIAQGETNAEFVSINGVPATGSESSCVTQVDGTCTVVVSSSEAGTLTLTASWSKELDSGTASRSETADKSYEDFRLTIDGGDATNEVGNEHLFTITLERDTGSGFVAYPDQTMTLSIDQAETDAEFVSINGEPASGTEGSCTTDENGQCTVVVNSSEAGTLTLSASWSRELDSGTATRSDEADKSYVDFELTVTPETAINEPGDEHEFIVTLRTDEGSGFTGLVGETITLVLDPNEPPAGIIRINDEPVDPPTTSDSCETRADGSCSVVINTTGTGEVVLTASWSTELDSGTTSREDSATKTYLSTFVDKVVECPTGEHVAPGGVVTYKITYGGEGATLENATLTDELPSQFRYESATPEPTSEPAQGESGTVVWEFGDLPDGTEDTVTITGSIDPSASDGDEVVNTATFTVNGVSEKVTTHTLTVSPDIETQARAYGARVELLGNEILGPTPDSNEQNPDSLLTLGDPVPADIARVELLSVQHASSSDETSAHTNAIATTASVRLLDQGDGDWLVTADAVRAVSSSFADITSAGSSTAGSELVNVTVDGQNLGTVTEPTTIEVVDPVLGTTATVKLLERIARGAADGVRQPDGELFASGLDVNAIHVTVRSGTGDVLADVVVAHASSDAQFRSGLGCVPTPTVAATGYALGTTIDEDIIDDSNTLFAGEVARVLIPSTGGDESATVEHTGPITLGDTFIAESNAAFTRSTGATDIDANTAIADTEAEIHALRLLGDGPGDPLISADTIRSTAHAEDLDGEQATSGNAFVENLVINGTNVCDSLGLESVCTPEPNTTIEVPGVLLVILNEQIDEGDNAITVNAIHIIVLGEGNALSLPVGAEIIVSSAHAAANAVAPEPDVVDSPVLVTPDTTDLRPQRLDVEPSADARTQTGTGEEKTVVERPEAVLPKGPDLGLKL